MCRYAVPRQVGREAGSPTVGGFLTPGLHFLAPSARLVGAFSIWPACGCHDFRLSATGRLSPWQVKGNGRGHAAHSVRKPAVLSVSDPRPDLAVGYTGPGNRPFARRRHVARKVGQRRSTGICPRPLEYSQMAGAAPTAVVYGVYMTPLFARPAAFFSYQKGKGATPAKRSPPTTRKVV